MNQRRDFLKKSILVAGGLVTGNSTSLLAATENCIAGVIYTKDNPGRWAKKVGSHAPIVSVQGKKVTITTKHGMSEKHYIVRHTLVSTDGKVLGVKTFYPSDAKPVSTYMLSAGAGSRFYATSYCNLHDFWLTEFSVE
ncbi:MAG: desulfoferrodoxin family protein [Desulfobacterales bacterium]